MQKNNFEYKFLEKYISAKKNYRKLLKCKKEEYNLNQINLLTKTKNSSDFWKVINSYRKKSPIIDHISLETWHTHLLDLFPTDKLTLQYIPLESYVDTLDAEITEKELLLCLHKLKNKKSPGPDKITYEFYKSLSKTGLEYMLFIFNKILKEEKIPNNWSNILIKMLYKKGDRKKPENYSLSERNTKNLNFCLEQETD